MGSTWIVCIVLLLLLAAIFHIKKHFRGGCCGSGNAVLRDPKKPNAAITGQVCLIVSGMHCQNCQNRIENVLNRIDGVVCSADRKKKTVTVAYSREVPTAELIEAVEKLGYHVDSVRK